MKNTQNIFFSIFLLFILFGCQQTVFINQQGYEPRVAVESDIKADSLPKIFVTETQNYYGYLDYKVPAKYIENAKVLLLHNGVADEMTLTEGKITAALQYIGNGQYDTIFSKQKYYLGHTPCQKGETYKLQITHNGKEVSSEMTIQNLIFPPAEAEQKVEIVTYPGGGTSRQRFVEVRIKDPAGLGSYYRARMYYFYVQYLYNFNPNTGEYEITDSTFVGGELLSELISDEVNDGGTIKLKFTPNIYPETPADTGFINTYISIECLDNASGKYLESIFGQYGGQGDPFTEPTLLYSNIKNGIGFFGASQVADTLIFPYKKRY